MAIDFASPSFRASSSDLTISISPLGLVELSDEEFEVHGPRLNRYGQNWAFYLGHHWAYRREIGEPQITFNYVRALSDFTTSFAFSRGCDFGSPDATAAITPYNLQRIWEKDNRKLNLLWEMGNMGSVTGDCFVKIAYEEPYETGISIENDPETGEQIRVPIPGVVNMMIPGKVRIIPLNSAYCFPEFHPHDRNRLIRFKLKYRFWGTGPEGTRQVFTYVELITDTQIEEYVNDQLIRSDPNPLGEIPIVHIRNLPVAGSPWGMADIQDVIILNRELNEKATDISDIINYHAAPVTVVIGAKSSNLEKGPKKVWGLPSKDAKIQNLDMDPAGVTTSLEYLKWVKEAMHEMTGVPIGALGQAQPISNTSGVALAIQYQPLMMKWFLKRIQYGQGIEQINKLALKTLYMKEPLALYLDPTQDVTPRDDALTQLDFQDPVTYENTVEFQSPLPVDQLVKLNEIQVKMALGLESKVGAMKDLGEEFPYEKLEELFKELVEDAEQQAALDYMRAIVAMFIGNQTGMFPGANGPEPVPPPPASGDGGGTKSAGGSNVSSAGTGVPQLGALPGINLENDDDVKKMFAKIVAMAAGTKIPQRRNPDNNEQDD